MPNPFAAKKKRSVREQGQWPGEYLHERIAMLFPEDSTAAFEDVVVAFGDPDDDPSAADVFNTSDTGLRRLVAIARGEEPPERAPRPSIAGDDDEPEEFDIGWTIARLLAFVGDDNDRARDVLNAEDATDSPRSTLIAALTKQIDG